MKLRLERLIVAAVGGAAAAVCEDKFGVSSVMYYVLRTYMREQPVLPALNSRRGNKDTTANDKQ